METAHTNPIFNSKRELFINHTQIEALLENIPDLIYMKDLNGNYINGTKNAAEFIKNGFDALSNIQIDLKSIEKTNLAEDRFVIDNNKTVSNEREIYDINGMPHYYTIYKAPIHNLHNRIIGLIVKINNVDKSKLLEAQKETFVASLGHDLKNPTLALISVINLLLKGNFGEMTESQKEILSMALDSCNSMKAMLSGLLATYRDSNGVIRLNYEEISLVDLVMECMNEMIYLAKDKDVGISISRDCKIPTVYGDKVQIKRVVMNLLSNGIKYAYKDSILNINIYNEDDYTCFRFENKSPYIPPDKIESIFAQYVSYASAHKELGIGLGLYNSQKIVEAHDGNIFVQSFQDDRNIFGFKIPNILKDADKPRTVIF